jgi:hypothetical protein
MALALGSRQDFFDVVEAPDQARSEVEPFGTKRDARTGPLERAQTRTQGIIHERLERYAAAFSFLFKPRRHIVINRQRRPHIVMMRP